MLRDSGGSNTSEQQNGLCGGLCWLNQRWWRDIEGGREEGKVQGRVYIADPSFFSLFVSFLSLCVLFSFIDGNTGRRGEVLFLPICGEEEYREVYWKEASYLLEVEVTFSGRHRCLLLPEDGTGAPVVHHVLWNTEQKQRNGIDEPKSCTIRRLRVNPRWDSIF